MTVFLPILCCVVKIRPLSFLVVPVRETLTLTHESAPTGDGFLPKASETVILRVVLLRPRVGIFLDRFVVEVSKSVLDSVHKSGLEGVRVFVVVDFIGVFDGICAHRRSPLNFFQNLRHFDTVLICFFI